MLWVLQSMRSKKIHIELTKPVVLAVVQLTGIVVFCIDVITSLAGSKKF
jgi:hypothetical protein